MLLSTTLLSRCHLYHATQLTLYYVVLYYTLLSCTIIRLLMKPVWQHIEKIRLYCIMSTYDSFIHIWGQKKHVYLLAEHSLYIKHMYSTHTEIFRTYMPKHEVEHVIEKHLWNETWKILSTKQKNGNRVLLP